MSEYRFEVRTNDLDQLTWMLEDECGLLLQRYDPDVHDEHGAATLNGVLPDSGAPSVLSIRMPRSLAEADLENLRRGLEAHRPRSIVYPSPFGRVVARYADSVGRVLVRDRTSGDEKFASGFVFGDRETLVTAAHVVAPPLEVTGVEFGREVVEVAGIVAMDLKRDIAVLRLRSVLLVSPLRRRRSVTSRDLGMQCIVIAQPDIPGMEPSPSFYELRLASVRSNYMMGTDVLELSTHLGSGASGAPVLNSSHALVGMVVGFPDSAEEHDQAYQWPRWTAVAVTVDDVAEVVARGGA